MNFRFSLLSQLSPDHEEAEFSLSLLKLFQEFPKVFLVQYLPSQTTSAIDIWISVLVKYFKSQTTEKYRIGNLQEISKSFDFHSFLI